MNTHNPFPLDGSGFLKVRISVSMLKCTYSCEYCVAASGQSQTLGVDRSQGMGRPDWGEGGLELSRRAAEWVAGLPYRVGVRYDVHGEPFLSDDVLETVAWLTRQRNAAFVEVQTNASLLSKKMPAFAQRADLSKLTLFCTFHHSQTTPDRFLRNVLAARDAGARVIANVLVFNDNVTPVRQALQACDRHGVATSADIRYPGFTVPLAADGRRARHFLSSDPFEVLLKAGEEGTDALKVVADSGPLGKNVRFLAALLAGLYGRPGRQCSAGYDYIFVDKWGDVYPCFSYADVDKQKMGSVVDAGFIPEPREEAYASCQYGETCHQKEEYGNLRILRDHRDLTFPSLNCFCGSDAPSETDQLYHARKTLIDLAWHALERDREGLFVPGNSGG